MQRYKVELSYDGSDYHGWQSQPNAITVQDTIESALKTLFQQDMSVVGCGRTDTGVHASQYFLHFDSGDLGLDLATFLYKMNSLLPTSIAVHSIDLVDDQWHARFSAVSRSYRYDISLTKPIFDRTYTHWWKGQTYSERLLVHLNEISTQLKQYKSWYPFCKTNSDVNTYDVAIEEMFWFYDEWKGRLSYHVKADRFLRGMIRLLVGAHMKIIDGKITLDEVLESMDNQSHLTGAYSAPAEGLCLVGVEY